MRYAVLMLVLVGCDGNGGAPLPDGARDSDGSPGDDGGSAGDDGGFTTAAHLPFPAVSLHTTSVFSAPQIVTITYSDFGFRNQVEQFGDFVVGSQWLDAVGKDYGVGHGTHLQKVELTTTAPASYTDANIVAYLKQHAGTTLPAPSAMNNQLVYLFYFPKTTKLNDGTGAILCQQAYSGYHSSSSLNGVAFVYAVLPDCTGSLDDLTSTVAHELIESATDPLDAWYLDVPTDDLWSGLNGQEVGDLCQDLTNVTESGWALQRSWSNSAAQAGASPCVPIPTGEVFTDVTPSPAKVVALAAGASTTFTLTGWSTAPAPDWVLASSASLATDFDPMAAVSKTPMNNDTMTTVTLTVPAGTASGKTGSAQIFTGMSSGNYWPVTVRVQ